MKSGRMAFMTAMAAVILTLSIGTAAHAQSGMVLVTIPFQFHLGTQTLPAGKYTVQRDSDNVIRIQDERGRSFMAIASRINDRGSKTPDAGLVFNRYENDYFLSEIRWGAAESARSLQM